MGRKESVKLLFLVAGSGGSGSHHPLPYFFCAPKMSYLQEKENERE